MFFVVYLRHLTGGALAGECGNRNRDTKFSLAHKWGQIESPQTYASLVGNMGYALWVINIETL